MVARLPESEPIIPLRKSRWRAYQVAVDPESALKMARSGSRLFSSWNTYAGLRGFASTAARSAMSLRQSRTSCSIFCRHDRPCLRLRFGKSARKVSALSPTRFTSIG